MLSAITYERKGAYQRNGQSQSSSHYRRKGTRLSAASTVQYNTIQCNFIDLRRRISPLVMLQDRDAWSLLQNNCAPKPCGQGADDGVIGEVESTDENAFMRGTSGIQET